MTGFTASIDGRTLTLTNLDKALYPDGFTKGEVVDYYLRVAPVILPHLRDRVVTRLRFPDGVDGISFYEKNPSPGLPSWVPTQVVVTSDSTVQYVLAPDAASLVALANLAAIELHTPQWRIPPRQDTAIQLSENAPLSDQVIIDLDPGPGIRPADQARAAILLATELAHDGLECVPRLSGGKGLQLLAAIAPTPGRVVTEYVRSIGARLAAQHPDLFVIQVTPSLREGRVFIDYNQNLPGRNTIALYSLRAGPSPAVCAPLTWDEVASLTGDTMPRRSAHDVVTNLEQVGDLAAGLLSADRPALPPNIGR